MQNRDLSLDCLKLFLIVTVVFGHVAGAIGGSEYLLGLIYLFHMPLFVGLSGYFTHKLSSEKFKHKQLDLVVSLLVFHFISLLMTLNISGHGISMLQPYWTLWYLLSLIFWKFIIQYTPDNVLKHKRTIIGLAIATSIVAGFAPWGYLFSFQRSFKFLPFFLMGYYMTPTTIEKIRNIPKLLSISVLLACVCVIILLHSKDVPIMDYLRCAKPYNQVLMPITKSIVISALCLVISTLSCMAIINLVVVRNKSISKEGSDSLMYYLYHGLLIKFLFNPIIRHWGIEPSLGLATLVSVMIMLVIYNAKKLYSIRFLAAPYKYLRMNRNI